MSNILESEYPIRTMVTPIGRTCTYSQFNRNLAETTNYLAKRTNYYAKAMFNFRDNPYKSFNESVGYKAAITESIEEVTRSYNKLIDTEYNRLYTKVKSIQNLFDKLGAKIKTATPDPSAVFVAGAEFFTPTFYKASWALEMSNTDNFDVSVYGAEKEWNGSELAGKQEQVEENIKKLSSIIAFNAAEMKRVIDMKVSNRDNDNFDSYIKYEQEIKEYIEHYKELNMAYDRYINDVNKYITLCLGNSTTGEEESEAIHESTVYDSLGIDSLFDNICIKSGYLESQLESIYIKTKLESLNETAETKTSVKEKFLNMLKSILAAIKKFVTFIRESWRKLKYSIMIKLDLYGKWATKHESELNKLTDKDIGNLTINTTRSTYGDFLHDIKSLNQVMGTMEIGKYFDLIPTATPGSPVEFYEKKLRESKEKWSRGVGESSSGYKERLHDFIIQKTLGTKNVGNVHKEKGEDNTFTYVRKVFLGEPVNTPITREIIRTKLDILKHSKELNAAIAEDMAGNVERIIRAQEQDEKNLEREIIRWTAAFNKGEDNTTHAMKVINEYYNFRRRIFSALHEVAGELSKLKLNIAMHGVSDAKRVLSYVLKSASARKTVSESISFTPDQYIKLNALFEDSSEACMNSELTVGGKIADDAKIEEILGHELEVPIAVKIEEKDIKPVAKMVDDSLLMKAKDGDTWVYHNDDKSLVNQNTFETVKTEPEILMGNN